MKLIEKSDLSLFNFAEVFGIPGDAYHTVRIWLAQQLLSSLKKVREVNRARNDLMTGITQGKEAFAFSRYDCN